LPLVPSVQFLLLLLLMLLLLMLLLLFLMSSRGMHRGLLRLVRFMPHELPGVLTSKMTS
jgi:hypothetical protein